MRFLVVICFSFVFLPFCSLQLKARETAAVIARELAEQTKSNLQAGDITYTVNAMVQLVDLLDVQLRNLTPGGKDSAARSLNKVAKETSSLHLSHFFFALKEYSD